MNAVLEGIADCRVVPSQDEEFEELKKRVAKLEKQISDQEGQTEEGNSDE